MNVVNIKQKQKRNDGLVYLPNETKPFTGMFVDWHPNGQKKDEVNYIDGWAVGTRTVWYNNAQKKKESNYIDGKEDGKYTQWYENGTKWIEQYYKDGKKDGKYTRWDLNGTKAEESNYIDGKKTSFIVMRLKKIGINPKK